MIFFGKTGKDMEKPGGNIQISSQSFSGWDKLEVFHLIFHILKGSKVGLVFSELTATTTNALADAIGGTSLRSSIRNFP